MARKQVVCSVGSMTCPVTRSAYILSRYRRSTELSAQVFGAMVVRVSSTVILDANAVSPSGLVRRHQHTDEIDETYTR